MKSVKATWFNRSGLGKDPTAMHGAPVSFSSHGSGLLPGQNLVMNMTGLQNGYRTPYFIDEIRMQAFIETATTLNNELIPDAAVSFQFRVGQHAFSQAPVPMIMHQPMYAAVSGGQGSKYAGNLFKVFGNARWILARPLLMMPGDAIQASAFRDAVAFAGNGTIPFSVDVAYVGRAMAPGASTPNLRHVPWIASFTHSFTNLWSHTGTEFRNPFLDRRLNVHRFVGRPLSNANTAGAAAGGFPSFSRFFMLPDPSNTKYASINITDSQGYKITDRYVPVGQVFDTERCTWTFNRPLGPREQYNMQFQTNGSVDATSVQFCVAMHGYRDE